MAAFWKHNCYKMKMEPKGPVASRLRQRKHQLLQQLAVPPDALSGTLSLTHSRCGKPGCHCTRDEGHPRWVLTYMLEGKHRVEPIPTELMEEIRRRVVAGRALKDAVNEILTANVQLLVLWRQQRRR